MMFGMVTKEAFFDKGGVVRRVDNSTRKVLSKFGAFVWKRAKTSIRPGKKASAPGTPPTSRTGLLRKHIYFAYDHSQRSVVIGPAPLMGVEYRGQIPAILEFGGRAIRGRGKTLRMATYPPRPFMSPAFDSELNNMPALWANSIKS